MFLHTETGCFTIYGTVRQRDRTLHRNRVFIPPRRRCGRLLLASTWVCVTSGCTSKTCMEVVSRWDSTKGLAFSWSTAKRSTWALLLLSQGVYLGRLDNPARQMYWIWFSHVLLVSHRIVVELIGSFLTTNHITDAKHDFSALWGRMCRLYDFTPRSCWGIWEEGQ